MKKLKTTLAALMIMSSSTIFADGHQLKVGMITTLSGGGSGLGIDVRDGFMLAVKGNQNISVIIKDDQRKPDIAVQLADKMIQSDKVDDDIIISAANVVLSFFIFPPNYSNKKRISKYKIIYLKAK
jgi:hypothetical protein